MPLDRNAKVWLILSPESAGRVTYLCKKHRQYFQFSHGVSRFDVVSDLAGIPPAFVCRQAFESGLCPLFFMSDSRSRFVV